MLSPRSALFLVIPVYHELNFVKVEKQMTLLPVGSDLPLSSCESISHVLQHVLIIGGSGTGYDGMADLVTDGTLRRPRGCLLAGHTRYTRNTVILCFRFRHADQTPPSGPRL